jgi:hypothetical protein
MSNAPVFILGVGRSGTTLLSLMIDSHSRIAVPYESHFFVPYYQNQTLVGDLRTREGRLRLLNRILGEPFVQKWDQRVTIEDIDLNQCPNLPETIRQIYSAYARKFGKDIWGDKTPGYIKHIYILNAMFPTARYIHIVRDGRDVALSLLKQSWGPDNLYEGLVYWAGTVAAGRSMLYMLPHDRYLEVRYEELVSQPEVELRRVVGFLGVAYEPQMLDAYVQSAATKVGGFINSIHVHLREPVSKAQTYKWKNVLGPVDQALASHVAGEMLKLYGYEPGITHHRFRTLRGYQHRLKSKLSALLQGKDT